MSEKAGEQATSINDLVVEPYDKEKPTFEQKASELIELMCGHYREDVLGKKLLFCKTCLEAHARKPIAPVTNVAESTPFDEIIEQKAPKKVCELDVHKIQEMPFQDKLNVLVELKQEINKLDAETKADPDIKAAKKEFYDAKNKLENVSKPMDGRTKAKKDAYELYRAALVDSWGENSKEKTVKFNGHKVTLTEKEKPYVDPEKRIAIIVDLLPFNDGAVLDNAIKSLEFDLKVIRLLCDNAVLNKAFLSVSSEENLSVTLKK
jgi:hypothetical protein